ncbi:hypothetical protein [Inconstantimicrobium porci]|uniref:hypothetical protein n=1 Tax=Inconstantimicrobium porci TaxID=2652291 RepID=UPI002409BD95|nr:hypothetical protein [Inconstantimicrobium porci]MDD6769490.1 hypothetical protein [Inconstantimicrobium porci]
MSDNLLLTRDMFTVDEQDIKEDILKGKALDMLLLILEESRTNSELSRLLNIPLFTTQLYLSRLLKANLIKVDSTVISEGKVEKTYSLAFKDLSIFNNINLSDTDDDNYKKNLIMSQNFSSMVKQAIENAYKDEKMPNKIWAYYMKTDKSKMEAFKKDLDELIKKYKDLECENGTETYSFFTVLAPMNRNK